MIKTLAFDFGASSGRAILGQYDGKRLTLEETHRFPNNPVQIGNSLHWDVLRLFYEIKQGIVQTVHQGHRDIASIGIDTWGVDFGLLDAQGNLLGNPYHYRDSRTDGMLDEACRIAGREEIFGQTGIELIWFNTLYQLMAMSRQGSAILEKADKLLMSTLKVGDTERIVVSGIAKFYTPEEMVGKKVVLLANLAPRKIRGVESHGMLLCAANADDSKLSLLTVDSDMEDGCEIG